MTGRQERQDMMGAGVGKQGQNQDSRMMRSNGGIILKTTYHQN